MKKLFEQILSGSLRQLPAEVTAENAPEGDTEEHFKAIVKTFEIASNEPISKKKSKARFGDLRDKVPAIRCQSYFSVFVQVGL